MDAALLLAALAVPRRRPGRPARLRPRRCARASTGRPPTGLLPALVQAMAPLEPALVETDYRGMVATVLARSAAAQPGRAAHRAGRGTRRGGPAAGARAARPDATRSCSRRSPTRGSQELAAAGGDAAAVYDAAAAERARGRPPQGRPAAEPARRRGRRRRARPAGPAPRRPLPRAQGGRPALAGHRRLGGPPGPDVSAETSGHVVRAGIAVQPCCERGNQRRHDAFHRDSHALRAVGPPQQPTSAGHRRLGGPPGAAQVAGLAGPHRAPPEHDDVAEERRPTARPRCRSGPRSAGPTASRTPRSRRRRTASPPGPGPARRRPGPPRRAPGTGCAARGRSRTSRAAGRHRRRRTRR